MSTRHFIVATAGHVDHGKSSLVKALTGTDPDRLPEEKARGITIDLGFAHLELLAPSPRDPRPSTLSLGIVDVPGHEDFVKNMVAGVGSIDLALFVVAADDGWMPQTEEHLQILTYLGVRHAVVALTKIDLVPGRETQVIARFREQLHATPFVDSPIVPSSVVTGQGLDELKSALATVLADVPPPADIGKPRLPIDRVFILHGIGTVVTGTLNGSSLRRNQTVVVQPTGQPARIRTLQTHNRDAEEIGPGTRTALNLPDLSPHVEGSGEVSRGQIVTVPELGDPSDTLDVLLEKSSRLARLKSTAARPLKDGALVRVHHGSANWPARVLLFDGHALAPGGRGFAQLRFEEKVFVLAGDRFILRDWPEQATLAGGLVLDADAQRQDYRNPLRRALLEARAAAPADAAVWVATQLACDRAVRRAGLLRKSRFGEAEIVEAVASLVAQEKAIAAGERLADAAWWGTLRREAGAAIESAHRNHPEKPGLDLSELRRVLESWLPAPELFDALLANLCQTGWLQVGRAIRHGSHRLALPAKLQAAGLRLRATLTAKPFEPPSRKELCPDEASGQALRFLLDTGEAVEVSAELVMAAEPFARARERVRQHLRERGTSTASDLRQLLGTSRRVIIPLLEKLDRDGVTRREGDARVLR